MIFGINTTSDISKFLYLISRAVRWVKFETILKYQISRTNPPIIICLYYYPQTVSNFHMKAFQIKLKYHSSKPIKCRNFSCSSIIAYSIQWYYVFKKKNSNYLFGKIHFALRGKTKRFLNLSLPVTVDYNSVALYSKLNQLFEHKRAMRNGDINSHINNILLNTI